MRKVGTMKREIFFMLALLLPLTVGADEVEIDALWYNVDTSGTTAEVIENKNGQYYSGNITIPNSVTYLGKNYSVTSIGDYAFSYCSGLTSVTIPNSVTSIGDYAFYGCSSLVDVYCLAEEVPNCDRSAFESIASKATLHVPLKSIDAYKNRWRLFRFGRIVAIPTSESVSGTCGDAVTWTYVESTRTLTIQGEGRMQDFDSSSVPWRYYYIENVIIMQGVSSIGNSAFGSCKDLSSITISNSVTSIGDFAFGDCSGLTSIDIPNSVSSIGFSAFYGCSGLTSIDIPNSVISIGFGAFQGCSGLISVTIGNSVTSISDSAFLDCTGLTSVTIPNSVTSIGNYAFCNCSGLTSVTIPSSLTSIGDYAFNNCKGLTSITIPNSLTFIGYSAFQGCSGLIKVVVPDLAAWCGVQFGDQYSNPLSYAKRLYSDENIEVTEIVIPDNVTSISYTFVGCSGLTSVTIPSSVTTIGDYAFYGCSGLTSIDIPSSVTSIGYYAFQNCSGLTSVTVNIDTPISIDESTFSNRTNATLYVPAGSKVAYEAADYWKEFKEIIEVANRQDLILELKTLIETAEAEDIDVSEAVAVYNNENASYDQIVKAIADLKDALKNNIDNDIARNPTDVSSLLTNPTFENASYTGWLGTAPNMTGSGSHGPANVAEHYNKTFDTYQNIANMPTGVYCLSARTFFRGTLADMLAGTGKEFYPYVYAVADNDTLTTLFNNAYAPMNTESLVDKYGPVTKFGTQFSETSSSANGVAYYIPNDPSSFRVYCEEEDAEGNNLKYYETLLFFEAQGGEVTIGVKKDAKQTDTDWAVFDTFGLKYYGNTAESYTVWVRNSAVKVVIPEGTVYTQSYVDAYTNACNATASNKAEALAALAAIEAAAADLQKNIHLWKEFEAVIAEANIVIYDATLRQSCRDDVADWLSVNETMNNATNRDKYTNEQIEAAVAELRDLILTAQKNPTTERDMTNLLVNPDFEQGQAGWTGFKSVAQVKWGGGSKNMPTTGGTATNTCAEAFSAPEFDLYQVVENVPVGVYEISVQGFCRNGRGDQAWSNYVNQTTYSQPGKFPVYVYLNAKQTPFVSVFSEPVEKGHYRAVDSAAEVYVNNEQEFPDGMRSSAVAFAEGMYVQKAYGLVAKDGDPIRIGVKGKSAGLGGEDDNWVIFDNFKLTFKGFQADVILPVLNDEIINAEEKAKETMGKDAYNALAAAIAAAKTAAAGENGEAMFESLSDLFDAESAADASIQAFVPLSEALEKLQAEKDIYLDQNPTAAAAAADLYSTIDGRLKNHDIQDSEIEDLINQINAAITALTDNTTVGIDDISRESVNDGYYYNLNGQRVDVPRKGLYIMNGKKVRR